MRHVWEEGPVKKVRKGGREKAAGIPEGVKGGRVKGPNEGQK